MTENADETDQTQQPGQTEIHDSAGAYAVDALTPELRHEFERHLATCEACRLEVAQAKEVAAELAEATAIRPPAALKGRILDRIGETPQAPVNNVVSLAERRRKTLVALRAAAAVIVVAAVGAAVLLQRQDSYSTEEIAARADAVSTELDGADGSVEVIWSPGVDRVAVIGQGLADPGDGMAYQLWLVVGDDVSSAGLFTAEAGNVNQVLPVEDLPAEGWGVTIEPAGGSEQPTSEILFLGLT